MVLRIFGFEYCGRLGNLVPTRGASAGSSGRGLEVRHGAAAGRLSRGQASSSCTEGVVAKVAGATVACQVRANSAKARATLPILCLVSGEGVSGPPSGPAIASWRAGRSDGVRDGLTGRPAIAFVEGSTRTATSCTRSTDLLSEV